MRADNILAESRISIIIIFWNEEKFIREAIASVVGQSYHNWDLILVDDGSSDGSTEIARCFAQEKPGEICYVEHPNHQRRGMSASRNLGLRHAHGEFIAFLDADDVWLPDKLQRQVAILHNHPEAAMVFGPVLRWHGWTGKVEDLKRDHIVPTGFVSDLLLRPPELLIRTLRREIVTTTCGLLRRTAIESVGGYEESFKGLYEDQVLSAKLSMYTAIFIEGECRYKWRRHPESCCEVSANTGVYRRERLIYLRWLENYLSRNHIDSSKLREVLREQLWRCRHWRMYRLMRYMKRALTRFKTIPKSVARKVLG